MGKRIKKYQDGRINISVWKYEDGKESYSVSIGNWKTNTLKIFKRSEIPKVITLLNKAYRGEDSDE